MLDFIKKLFRLGKGNLQEDQKIFQSLNLIRECTTIVEKDKQGQKGKPLALIRSNRAQFNIDNHLLVVRGRYLHITLRVAATLIEMWEQKGSFKEAEEDVPYEAFIEKSLSPFDQEEFVIVPIEYKNLSNAERDKKHKEFVPKSNWVQIYLDGKLVYSSPDAPPAEIPYMEVIEQCAVIGEPKSYEQSLIVAEHLFAESGQVVEIVSDSILSVNIKEGATNYHTGMVYRSLDGKSVFSFTINKGGNNPVDFRDIVSIAGEFAESINLSYHLGLIKKAVKYASSSVTEKDLDYGKRIRVRRNLIERRLDDFEALREIRFRPERPLLRQDDDFSF